MRDISQRIVGKTAARGTKGMVTAHNVEAAEAGAQVLADGGTAEDAIIAMSAVTAVREVSMNSLGGVGVMLHHDGRTGVTREIDVYGRTPSGLAEDAFVPYLLPRDAGETTFGYRSVKGNVHERGAMAVGVPGLVAGLASLHSSHGTVDWGRLWGPAERLAREGFEPDSADTFSFASEYENLRRFDEIHRIFFSRGIPRPSGFYQGRSIDVVQPDLADTIATISEGGADAFYRGDIAQAISSGVQSAGGFLTPEDFARFEAETGAGLRGSYRGYEIVTSSGPNGGVTLLQMLNLAEHFDLGSMDRASGRYYHLLAEIMRQAWTDRFLYMGDPDRMPVPMDGLIDKRYAAELHGRIPVDRVPAQTQPGDPWAFDPGRPSSAEATGDLGGSDTTHLIAADSSGSIVTLTQTLGIAFGSCFVPPGTGLSLYNMTMWMNPEPGTPSSVRPWSKQVGHAAPTIIKKDGRVVAAIGAPGARRIVSALFQTIVNMVDFGMNVQDAIGAPRIHYEGAKPRTPRGAPTTDMRVDDRIPSSVLADLAARGHTPVVTKEDTSQSLLARPLGIQYTEDGMLGGVDVFHRSLAIGL